MHIIPDRDKTRNWYLDEPVKLELINGDTIHVDRGYRFDGHSVPLIFRWLFPRYNEQDIVAALVHDALLDTMPWHRYPRKFIDLNYSAYMQDYSTPKRAFWMPLAVRVWGFIVSKGWSDYRGDYNKYQTTVRVTVEQKKRVV